MRPLADRHRPLPGDARDAFAARVLLARAAYRSLDVQYYIWHPDVTGGLLCEALWETAERGVRVRLLLDDNNTRGMDQALAALDAHPNIEVRLFNPYANRGLRFGADSPVAFADLDVLAVGAVVREVSASFDAYWNSESAYSAASLITTPPRNTWAEAVGNPAATNYLDAWQEIAAQGVQVLAAKVTVTAAQRRPRVRRVNRPDAACARVPSGTPPGTARA